MPACRKCGDHFPWRMKIDGRRRYLGARRYCLVCSPFGQHNTRKLELFEPEERICCADCGKPLGSSRRRKCSWCYVKQSWRRRQQRLRHIVRARCCLCGYIDRSYFGILHFHHVDANTKRMSVANALRGRMKYALEEVLKCVPVCPTCHAEVHAGLVLTHRVCRVHNRFWTRARRVKLEELQRRGGRAA